MAIVFKNYGEAEGTVTFTPSIPSVVWNGVTYTLETVEVTLDSNGLLVADLQPNDIGDTQGWTYTVVESFGETYSINLPRGSFPLDAVRVPAPSVGTNVLDERLTAIIEDTDSTFRERVEELVADATETHTPGIELGYASRVTNFTTTNTSSLSAAGDIPTFSVTVVGTGRPVDVRFMAAGVYHSIANTAVSAAISVGGSVSGSNSQIGSCTSGLTTSGPSLHVSRRTGILTAGTSYTFGVRVWSAAAGTATLVGAGFCPLELTVTSR